MRFIHSEEYRVAIGIALISPSSRLTLSISTTQLGSRLAACGTGLPCRRGTESITHACLSPRPLPNVDPHRRRIRHRRSRECGHEWPRARSVRQLMRPRCGCSQAALQLRTAHVLCAHSVPARVDSMLLSTPCQGGAADGDIPLSRSPPSVDAECCSRNASFCDPPRGPRPRRARPCAGPISSGPASGCVAASVFSPLIPFPRPPGSG